jgi:glycyl-tRNA synthetase alpha subunit
MEIEKLKLQNELSKNKKKKEEDKLPITQLLVRSIVKLNGQIRLITDDNNVITVGTKLSGWEVIKIDVDKKEVWVKKGKNITLFGELKRITCIGVEGVEREETLSTVIFKSPINNYP